MRLDAMQTWPLVAKVAMTMRSIASGPRSASSRNSAGSLPPSSMTVGVMTFAAVVPIATAVVLPPVEAILRISGCETSGGDLEHREDDGRVPRRERRDDTERLGLDAQATRGVVDLVVVRHLGGTV